MDAVFLTSAIRTMALGEITEDRIVAKEHSGKSKAGHLCRIKPMKASRSSGHRPPVFRVSPKVAAMAECNQIRQRVIFLQKVFVVDVQPSSLPTILTAVSIALKHLLFPLPRPPALVRDDGLPVQIVRVQHPGSPTPTTPLLILRHPQAAPTCSLPHFRSPRGRDHRRDFWTGACTAPTVTLA
jgi:hypothetical protein